VNAAIVALFSEYLNVTGGDHAAAASLVLADALIAKTPEPVIVEPEDCRSYTVKDAARRLNLSSKKVYQMCIAGELRCFKAGRAIRISTEEIERFETER
jgi:excisionase family DNA binding protein